MGDEKSDLASQCMAFCQALASKGQIFSFTLNVGSSFAFSLDTRENGSSTLSKTRCHSPWCPRKRRRRSQLWGWSWRFAPCWPAPGRKPCTGMPSWTCLHPFQEQPFSVISELKIFHGEPRENTCCFWLDSMIWVHTDHTWQLWPRGHRIRTLSALKTLKAED